MAAVPPLATLRYAAVITAFFVLPGCRDAPPPAPPPTPVSRSGAGAAAPLGALADEKVGITECDAYVARYVPCILKMPDEARASAEATFRQTLSVWKQAAQVANGRAALEEACRQSIVAIQDKCK